VPAVAPLAAPAPSGVRRVAARLAAAAADPVFVGAAALLAVLAAIVAVALGTGDTARMTAITLLGAALLMPLSVLTLSAWPDGMRQVQLSCIGFIAVFCVVVLGLIGAGDLTLDRADVLEVVLLSGVVTSGLHVLPRRLDAVSRR
jgi:fumarate reductase subunit D